MNRLDTIIDALECARNEINDPTLWTDKVDEAIAAARELKENLNLEQFAEFVRSIKEQK